MDTATKNASTTTTVIAQGTLIHLIEMKNQITRLEIEKAQLEDETKNLLMAGAKIEEGVHTCELKTLPGRRSPKWKEEAIALADRLKGAGAGDKWAEKVLENTEASPDSLKLKID